MHEIYEATSKMNSQNCRFASAGSNHSKTAAEATPTVQLMLWPSAMTVLSAAMAGLGGLVETSASSAWVQSGLPVPPVTCEGAHSARGLLAGRVSCAHICRWQASVADMQLAMSSFAELLQSILKGSQVFIPFGERSA